MFDQPTRAPLTLWSLAASANLLAGVALASLRSRQHDLDTIRRWGSEWLVDGVNVYATGLTDYPPHAIVLLSPLGVLPRSAAVAAWTMLNVMFAVLASYLAVRAMRSDSRAASSALLTAMFLCWGGFRTLLQFSLLPLTLSLLAMVLADKRRGWSGICLGVALMKPQVSAPFLLWALFTRRLRVVAVALATMSVLFAIFCLRIPVNPLLIVREYAETLRLFYFGAPVMVGLSELRPLTLIVFREPILADTIAAAIAISLLAAICLLGFNEGRRRNALMYSAPPLAALWSLTVFYHLTYGFVILLPLGVLLSGSAADPRTATLQKGLFWLLQAAMMVDVPGVWSRAGPAIERPLLNAVAGHFDRGLMIALIVGTWVLARRRREHMARHRGDQ